MPDFVIKSDERVTTVGKTGSGKTFLNRLLTRSLPRFVLFDPKGTLYTPEALEAWGVENWSPTGERTLMSGKPIRLRVGPMDISAADTLGSNALYAHWLPYLRRVYEAGDVALYIDEMYGVTKPGSPPSPELTAIYTRGRELGIGVFASTQRPSWVPLFLLSEVEWTFTFRLTMEDDRLRMAALCGQGRDSAMAQPIPPSDPYGYWLYNSRWEAPIYSRGVGA